MCFLLGNAGWAKNWPPGLAYGRPEGAILEAVVSLWYIKRPIFIAHLVYKCNGMAPAYILYLYS